MFNIILESLKIRKNNKGKFLRITRFLKKGRYFSNETGTLWFPKRCEDIALSENKHIIMQVTYENRNGSKLDKNLKDKLIERLYSQKVNSQPTLFLGDVAMMSRLDNVGKVIDYFAKEMLSYFANDLQMRSVIEKRLVWQNLGYKVLPIKKIDEKNCFFTEDFIEKQDYPPEIGFDYIKDDILRCHKFCGGEACRPYTPDEIARKEEGMKKRAGAWTGVSAAIDYIRSDEYVKRICHGDLYRNNLLFDGKEFYYIDFELLSEHVFYFDVLNYIMCERLMFDNGSMLDNYFCGAYDGYFDKLFSVNGCDFDPKKRKVYYFTVLYEYYCETFQTDIPDKLREVL